MGGHAGIPDGDSARPVCSGLGDSLRKDTCHWRGFSGFGHRDLLASVLSFSSILVDSVSMYLTEG